MQWCGIHTSAQSPRNSGFNGFIWTHEFLENFQFNLKSFAQRRVQGSELSTYLDVQELWTHQLKSIARPCSVYSGICNRAPALHVFAQWFLSVFLNNGYMIEIYLGNYIDTFLCWMDNCCIYVTVQTEKKGANTILSSNDFLGGYWMAILNNRNFKLNYKYLWALSYHFFVKNPPKFLGIKDFIKNQIYFEKYVYRNFQNTY